MPRLDGKIALVTGAGAGIGEAIARRFRAEGASLVVNDLDADRAKRVASEVGLVVRGVADSGAAARMSRRSRAPRSPRRARQQRRYRAREHPSRAERFASATLADAERATSGVVKTHTDVTLETTDAEWERMIAVHPNGTFFCTREALRIMRRSSLASSTWARSWAPRRRGYPATARRRRASSVHPRARARTRDAPDPRQRDRARLDDRDDGTSRRCARSWKQTPLGRMGSPDDIAYAAVYLASDESGFVTGQVLSPNGGWHMSQ
jgi:3-oxoacyl-[acyl-carrier protein] reductase